MNRVLTRESLQERDLNESGEQSRADNDLNQFS